MLAAMFPGQYFESRTVRRCACFILNPHRYVPDPLFRVQSLSRLRFPSPAAFLPVRRSSALAGSQRRDTFPAPPPTLSPMPPSTLSPMPPPHRVGRRGRVQHGAVPGVPAVRPPPPFPPGGGGVSGGRGPPLDFPTRRSDVTYSQFLPPGLGQGVLTCPTQWANGFIHRFQTGRSKLDPRAATASSRATSTLSSPAGTWRRATTVGGSSSPTAWR